MQLSAWLENFVLCPFLFMCGTIQNIWDERLSCWNNTSGRGQDQNQSNLMLWRNIQTRSIEFWNLSINLLFRRHFIHPCVNTHVDLSDLRNLFLSVVNCQYILSTSNLPLMSYFWYSQLCFYLIDDFNVHNNKQCVTFMLL